MKTILLSALFLSQVCIAQQARSVRTPSEEKSIRQLQHEEYSKYNFTRQEQWDSLYLVQNPGAKATPKNPAMQRSACSLKKRVFGWHPYWLASNEYLNYDYSLLSDLSYF